MRVIFGPCQQDAQHSLTAPISANAFTASANSAAFRKNRWPKSSPLRSSLMLHGNAVQPHSSPSKWPLLPGYWIAALKTSSAAKQNRAGSTVQPGVFAAFSMRSADFLAISKIRLLSSLKPSLLNTATAPTQSTDLFLFQPSSLPQLGRDWVRCVHLKKTMLLYCLRRQPQGRCPAAQAAGAENNSCEAPRSWKRQRRVDRGY